MNPGGKRIITMPTLKVNTSAGAFSSNTSGSWGYNALFFPEGSSLEEVTSDTGYILYRDRIIMNLTLAGVAAHAQFVADHIRVADDVTEGQTMEMVKKVCYSDTLQEPTWATPFNKADDGTVTGSILLLDKNGASFTADIHTKTAYVYTPEVVEIEEIPMEEIEEPEEEPEEIDIIEEEEWEEYEEWVMMELEDEITEPSADDEEEVYKRIIRKKKKSAAKAGLSTVWIIVIIAAAVIVLAGGTVLTIFLLRKRRKKSASGEQAE